MMTKVRMCANLFIFFIVPHITSSTLEIRYILFSFPPSLLCLIEPCVLFSFTTFAVQLTLSAQIPG